MIRAKIIKRFGAVLVGVMLGGAALAADLPKLPGKLTLPQGTDSPGPVAFNHDMHVDTSKPAGSCSACHPRHFRILAPFSRRERPRACRAGRSSSPRER